MLIYKFLENKAMQPRQNLFSLRQKWFRPSIKTMEFGIKISLLVSLFFALSANADTKRCSYPAIFNFGDSNSDTGGSSAIYNGTHWPYGMSVGHTWKRASDGRLIIDYLAENLGIPYLNSSLDKNGTTYKYGANFAVGGQRINPDEMPGMPLFWHFSLEEQVDRFFDLKSRAIANPNGIYPDAEVFKDALYTIDIGQNDVGSYFGGRNILDIGEFFTKSVERLLTSGAKYLWIHNTCPFGCLSNPSQDCPNFIQKTCTRDKYGCIVEHNLRSQQLNSELEKRVQQLRTQHKEAVITLVDMYSAKYDLFNHIQGFDDSLKLKFCCGNKLASCSQYSVPSKENNYTKVFGGACKDPSKYLNWDGFHYTQAANKYLADQIFSGLYSQPRVTLAESCISH